MANEWGAALWRKVNHGLPCRWSRGKGGDQGTQDFLITWAYVARERNRARGTFARVFLVPGRFAAVPSLDAIWPCLLYPHRESESGPRHETITVIKADDGFPIA